jgi:hypothetical protein
MPVVDVRIKGYDPAFKGPPSVEDVVIDGRIDPEGYVKNTMENWKNVIKNTVPIPEIPELPDLINLGLATLADIEARIKAMIPTLPVLSMPKLPELPPPPSFEVPDIFSGDFSELANISIPNIELPGLAELPSLPELPEIPDLPDLPF